MAKKITNRTDYAMQGYEENEDPYICVLEWLLKGKTDEEAAQEKQAFEESFTYLLICEEGRFSPPVACLLELYQAEREKGIRGFFRKIIEVMPTYFD